MPPSVSTNHDAYVDLHDWPQEMEDEVRKLHRHTCTVPGCEAYANTLDLRIPYDPGKTCMTNLFPMCSNCNSSKGRKIYMVWLLSKPEAKFTL